MNYFTASARLPGGWADNVLMTVSAEGVFERIQAGVEAGDARRLGGPVVPAIPNCHSHAFQRAMAGKAEFRLNQTDSFWSWRTSMYSLAGKLSANTLYAIAYRAFVEMLKAGYTTVAEFHYLLRTSDGPDGDPVVESIEPLQRAAREAGIRLLLLPALYQRGGFSGEALNSSQQRFSLGCAEFDELLSRLVQQQDENFRLGMAIHSLRAVDTEKMAELISTFREHSPRSPIHLHIAEQQAEVDDCVAHTGKRPLEWLLENQALDRHWCLIHATHSNATERAALAQAGVVIGLCPTTEANLGDGVFAAADWLQLGGAIAIGSDSNVSISPCEELRWLEYAQRLHSRQRTVLASSEEAHVGDRLWSEAVRGGAQAMGQEHSGIVAGAVADFLVLDDTHPILHASEHAFISDALVFAGNENLVRDVVVGGQWRIKNRVHAKEADSRDKFLTAINEISYEC